MNNRDLCHVKVGKELRDRRENDVWFVAVEIDQTDFV
jgi:hypothetical protein